MLLDLWNAVINYTYPALLLTVPLLLLATCDLHSWQQRIRTLLRERGWLALFLFCLAFIIEMTVLSRRTTVPYNSVFKHFGPGDEKWNNEIIENILLFIPLVFCYLQAFPGRQPLLRALRLSAVLTLFIELSQLLFWLGEFQFSDLFHNLVGGLAGFGLWSLFRRLRPIICRKGERL